MEERILRSVTEHLKIQKRVGRKALHVIRDIYIDDTIRHLSGTKELAAKWNMAPPHVTARLIALREQGIGYQINGRFYLTPEQVDPGMPRVLPDTPLSPVSPILKSLNQALDLNEEQARSLLFAYLDQCLSERIASLKSAKQLAEIWSVQPVYASRILADLFKQGQAYEIGGRYYLPEEQAIRRNLVALGRKTVDPKMPSRTMRRRKGAEV